MGAVAEAKLCRDCGFGVGAKKCVLCGKMIQGQGTPAHLCANCSFGDKKNLCVKCGKPALSSSAPKALICGFCSVSISKRQSCARCGKHITGLQVEEAGLKD